MKFKKIRQEKQGKWFRIEIALEFLNDKPKQTKPTRIPETIQNLVIGSHIKKSRHINRLSGLIRNLKQLHFRRFHKVTSFGPIEVKSTCDFSD